MVDRWLGIPDHQVVIHCERHCLRERDPTMIGIVPTTKCVECWTTLETLGVYNALVTFILWIFYLGYEHGWRRWNCTMDKIPPHDMDLMDFQWLPWLDACVFWSNPGAMARFQAAVAWSAMVLDLSAEVVDGDGDPSRSLMVDPLWTTKTSDWWLLTYYE